MKIEQISEHIWSLKTWFPIPVRVWLVVDETGVTLVDAGFSFMHKSILRLLDTLQAGPLQRILLTHGHADHVGSVQKLLQHKPFPVPVYVHQIELPYLEGDRTYPRRKKPEQNLPKGLAQPLPEQADGTLQSFGGLTPYLAPGHSPGHVVYYHEQDGVLLAGDLFTSKNGKLRRPMPMFTADMGQALKSSTLLRRLNPKRVEICHSAPVFQPALQLDEYLRTTAAAYSIPNSAFE